MAQRRIGMSLLVGGSLLAFGGMTARSGGSANDVAAPMDGMLAADAATWDLTPTRNDAVENWIEFLSERNANQTRLWMERSGKYAPMIQAELHRRDMPQDLLYLAFIESGFTPRAYSTAAASGIWQFIAETGRRYGLEVNAEVDERRDPLKSTGAALDYLQELHNRFGSWYLAAAAYNSGENRIARIMREETGSERGHDSLFWKIAPRLPKETRNYVPLMLAAGYINKQPVQYGFTDVAYQDPLAFEVAWVPGGTPLSVVAQAAGVTDSVVKDLNPHLMKGRTPAERGWAVRIPSGSKTALEENFVEVNSAYRVRAAAEQKLAMAQQVKAAKVAKAKAAKSKAARVYTVRRGDNLSVIADRHNTSVKRIKSLNGLKSTTLRPGQRLRITT